MQPLRAYQEDAVARIVSGEVGLCSLEQGLGKTRVAIEAAARMNVKNTLVVCPASVKPVWASELRKWSPHKVWINLPESVRALPGLPSRHPRWTIINPDKLSRGDDYINALLKMAPFCLMILDESHMFKTAGANRTKAVFDKLAPHCKQVLALSGTPVVNHLGDLFPILKHRAPWVITKTNGSVMTQFEYEAAFCKVEEKRIGLGRPIRVITGSKNQDVLKKRIGSWMLRGTKAEHLKDLPPLQFVTVPLAPTADGIRAVAEYEHIITPGMSDDEVLKVFQSSDENVARLRAALGYAKAASAVPYLQDHLMDSRHKIVVWAVNKNVIDHLMSGLVDYGPVKIDGSTPAHKRGDVVEDFLNNPKRRVFVGQITAAGSGITLLNEKTQPKDCFFVQSSYVPGEMAQAAARIHRLGQKDGVLARIFVSQGIYLDERVQEILLRKADEIAELFT